MRGYINIAVFSYAKIHGKKEGLDHSHTLEILVNIRIHKL